MDERTTIGLEDRLESLIKLQQESVDLQKRAATRLDSIEEKVGCFYIVWLISLVGAILLVVVQTCSTR